MEGGGEYQIVCRLCYLTQQCIDLRKHGNHGALTECPRGTHGISQGTYLPAAADVCRGPRALTGFHFVPEGAAVRPSHDAAHTPRAHSDSGSP